MAIKLGQDRRRLLPSAVMEALTALINSETGPSSLTIELKAIRTRVARAYGLANPGDPARETDVMQHVAEEDGDGVPDTV